jgi:hypothetical protein
MAIRGNAGSMIPRDAYGNPTGPTGLKLKSKKRGLLNKNTNIGAVGAFGGSARTDAMNRVSGLTEIEKPKSLNTKMGIEFNTPGRGTEEGVSPYSTSMDVGKVLTGAGSDVIGSIAADQTKKLVANQAAKKSAKQAAKTASNIGAKAALSGIGTGAAGTAAGSIGAATTAQTVAATTSAATTGLTAAAQGSGVVAGTAGTAATAASGGLKEALTSPEAVNAYKTLGVGAAAEAGKAFGNTKIKNKKEDAGYSLRGASKGANIGASVGSFIPVPGGTFIGAGIGAGIGAITGAFKGKQEMKKRKKQERIDERERVAYNKKIKGIKRRELGKAADIDSYRSLISDVGRYSNGGSLRFKKGGILKYSELNVKEGMSYLNSLVDPEEKEKSKIFRLQKGGHIKLKAKKVKKLYKRGGKVSKGHSGCGCSSCMKSMKEGGTPKFRRGGKLDVAKQNVILDGPSHDQKNNTGVAGDKGLPIVKNGEKVAEIESNELVLNAEASKKIDALKRKIKSGDDNAKEELANLLQKELGENTYDYNKSL